MPDASAALQTHSLHDALPIWDVPDDTRDAFFALAGKEKAKIVVIPTAIATADEPETSERVLKPWRDLKPASVVLLQDRKSTRLNSSHSQTSYAVFCLNKKRAN